MDLGVTAVKLFVSASHQTGLDTRSNDLKVGLKWGLGEGKVRHKSRFKPCWSLTHLVQCGPDEPSWTWTQIWVQAGMPDYSLNWTMKSSVIQGWQKCLWCSLPTWRWPSQSQGTFGLESAIDIWYPTMKGYPTFPKTPGLEPHHQIQFRVIYRTLVCLPSAVIQSTPDNWVTLTIWEYMPNSLFFFFFLKKQIIWRYSLRTKIYTHLRKKYCNLIYW